MAKTKTPAHLTLKLASDTGASASDLVTGNGSVLATPLSAKDTLSYRYSADGGTTWTAWAGTGATIPAPASDGTWTLQVRELAGNKLTDTASLTFKLDTHAAAPVLTLVNDTGLAGDHLTADGTVAVAGLEAGSTLQYSHDGGTTWQAAFTAQEGPNTVLARQTDVAGNVSAMGSLQFTLDTAGPAAQGDAATTQQDAALAIDVLSNDSDASGVSLQSLGTAGHGTVAVDANGSVLYTPDAGFSGTDSFTYDAVDAAGNVSTSTVSITVTPVVPVIDPPPPSGNVFTPVTPQDTTAAAVVHALLAPSSGIVVDTASCTWHESGVGATNLYDGSLTALGIGAGVLLTSGTTPGTANTVQWFGVDNTDPNNPNGADNGDPDLDRVVNSVFSTVSYDATTLSFDFTVADPASTSISFDLVFGSDEFPEWVDQFVDLAIVMVNGQNVALFDHNNAHPLSVIGSNLAGNYFIDNAAGVLPIEYDGVSAKLRIVAPVHAGTNTLKIAIGDTGDHIYDSGAFIANLQAGNLPGTGMLIDDGLGTSGQDTSSGGAGSELIDTQGGDDSVNAGAGDDVVLAGDGNDSISGGSGSDQLVGGAGSDKFDYSDLHDWAVDGLDTITDFCGNTVALANASSLDAINGDVLVFSAAVLAGLAGATLGTFELPAAGRFSTLAVGSLSSFTDGQADADHAQFVYDSATGIVGFDPDGTGALASLAVTLIGTRPAEMAATDFAIEG